MDNLSKETTPLHRIFGGYLRNEVSCHTCGRVSTTFQLFQDLFLDIRLADSLTQSMKGFFSWEKLEGGEKDNCYKCEQCRDRGNCSKRVYIQMPPKVLCIQLKRFTALGKKITKHINYPIKLDLSPYIYNGLSKSDSPYKGIVQPLPYKLVSVVSHYGAALNCGHYTAIGLSAKGSYFMFDDSQRDRRRNSFPFFFFNVVKTKFFEISGNDICLEYCIYMEDVA
ncbi:hypothetical protein J437_LFUL016549 [Ladona fulva]|uniref:Ubiquitin carboxyl-terminal hydrolase 36 n=1 Tax=Ladona fulva TaxID=123851 RepID=A0A8K0P7Q4_LADFU|nr:hypothetical protein J437_LFUL016549 [Ladona fulva]